MQGDGGEDGQQVGEAGRDISSTPSGDVEILEEQDQELVVGTGTHLGGVVAKARAKVKHTNASEKVTVDVLSRRILEYGLVKAERATNLVWHYFKKFCPKKLAVKRPVIDPLRLQHHALCMLCYESTDQDRREHVTVKLGKCKSPTAMVDHMQKHHKEEWAELHKAGKQQQSMKSFTAQHSPKKTQSTPGAAQAASAVGAVARPDSLSGAAKHADSETRFAHVKEIFKQQDTGRPVATEGVQGSTDGAQGSMRAHFKSKEQGWDNKGLARPMPRADSG